MTEAEREAIATARMWQVWAHHEITKRTKQSRGTQ